MCIVSTSVMQETIKVHGIYNQLQDVRSWTITNRIKLKIVILKQCINVPNSLQLFGSYSFFLFKNKKYCQTRLFAFPSWPCIFHCCWCPSVRIYNRSNWFTVFVFSLVLLHVCTIILCKPCECWTSTYVNHRSGWPQGLQLKGQWPLTEIFIVFNFLFE